MKKSILALALAASVFGYVAAEEATNVETTETVVAQAPEVTEAPAPTEVAPVVA